MSIINETEIRMKTLEQVALFMMAAARTAPKGRGIDTLQIITVKDDTLRQIVEKMKEIGKKPGSKFFLRDAENLSTAGIAVLIGTRIQTTGLSYCSLCGFNNCAEKNTKDDMPCVYNTLNLGIALGSAVAVAATHHIDSRIMYSIGKAAMDCGILDMDIKVCMAIPLSCTSKNIFFDRPLKV